MSGGEFQRTRAAERRHPEADRLERRPEERILLEAIAAAPAVHELLLHGSEVEPHRPPEQRIEALERDRIDVPRIERRKRRVARFERSVEADPREIVLQSEGSRHGQHRGAMCRVPT